MLACLNGLRGLGSLTRCDLSGNVLEHVPAWMGSAMPQLEELGLAHNRLSSLRELRALRPLRHLHRLSVLRGNAGLERLPILPIRVGRDAQPVGRVVEQRRPREDVDIPREREAERRERVQLGRRVAAHRLVVVARDHHRGHAPRAENLERVDERLHRDGAARVPEVAEEDDAR
mgnify:CR=1 FL=1